MLALIGTVVEDLRGDDLLQKTRVWNYVHRGDASEPFGFVAICSHFGWSQATVQRELGRIDTRRARTRWRTYAG